MVTMAASDEHFRRPGGQEQFADGFGGNGIGMRVAADVRVSWAASRHLTVNPTTIPRAAFGTPVLLGERSNAT
jgi:hypothetical protein